MQLCERALTSLKYFCEDAPGYHIAALGSLLGVAAGRKRFSFPVGKVDMKTLYPMDMEEFMLAVGEDALAGKIKECFENRHADAVCPSTMRRCSFTDNTLLWAGCRNAFCSLRRQRDYILVRHTQDTILASYLNDMSKYNSVSEIKKNPGLPMITLRFSSQKRTPVSNIS